MHFIKKIRSKSNAFTYIFFLSFLEGNMSCLCCDYKKAGVQEKSQELQELKNKDSAISYLCATGWFILVETLYVEQILYF